jgi:hypothetical protein
MPLQVQQQEHMPSESIRHRFCSVPVATSSSQRHWILQPSLVFSNFSVQRGTTHQLAAAGAPPGNELGWNPPIGPPSGVAAEDDLSKRTDAAITNSFSFGQPIENHVWELNAVDPSGPTRWRNLQNTGTSRLPVRGSALIAAYTAVAGKMSSEVGKAERRGNGGIARIYYPANSSRAAKVFARQLRESSRIQDIRVDSRDSRAQAVGVSPAAAQVSALRANWPRPAGTLERRRKKRRSRPCAFHDP